MITLQIEHLCRISGALCLGDETVIRNHLEAAIADGVQVSQLREVTLMSYLFDGFPTALEGFRILNEVLKSENSVNYEIPWNHSNLVLWKKRGEALCKKVYGEKYEQLMKKVASVSAELKDAMVVEGYGKVLARPMMPILEREFCIISMLVIKNKPHQLESHTLGALRCGATESDLKKLISILEPLITKDMCFRLSETFNNLIVKYKKICNL